MLKHHSKYCFIFRFKINFCTDLVRKRILSNISRCIASIIVGPNICQVSAPSVDQSLLETHIGGHII